MIVLIVERERLDRVRHVRDDLHRRAEIVPATFLRNDVAIDTSRGDVVALPGRHASEAFVVTEIEIGFRTVIGDVNLAVLIRAHRAWVDIQVRVELADTHLVPTCLKKGSKRCCHETFAER